MESANIIGMTLNTKETSIVSWVIENREMTIAEGELTKGTTPELKIILSLKAN